jgi:hypothetical protein
VTSCHGRDQLPAFAACFSSVPLATPNALTPGGFLLEGAGSGVSLLGGGVQPLLTKQNLSHLRSVPFREGNEDPDLGTDAVGTEQAKAR